MKKTLKLVLIVCMLAITALLGGCASLTQVEEYQQKGYKIMVTYDGNGGSFLDRTGVTIVDMFNPDHYQKDVNGEIHIKLTEPTDESRETSGSEGVSLTMPNNFFAGWYKTRTVKEVNGVPVDKAGKELKKLDDGTYVYLDTADTDKPVTATPAYEYSDYWDFENDTIDYSSDDGIVKITLYAGWVEYYEFNYFYKIEGESTWTKMDKTTTFDYKTTNATGSVTHDKDTIWMPRWEDGAVNYEHRYSNSEIYSFPVVAGTTFKEAYEDENCSVKITDSLVHKGTLDIEKGKAVDRIQNVYVVLEKGTKYRIETADQLISHASVDGIYEIKDDLDFTDKKWPSIFSVGTFTGKMFSTTGNTFKIKNATATISNEMASACGLFGTVSATAEIKNLTFENTTVDLAYVGQRQRNRKYAMFAGNIAEGAKIEGVTIDGTFKIGAITPGDGYAISLIANGNKTGITNNGVALQLYGVKRGEKYQYSVADPSTVTVEEDGVINITFASSTVLLDQDKFDINIG